MPFPRLCEICGVKFTPPTRHSKLCKECRNDRRKENNCGPQDLTGQQALEHLKVKYKKENNIKN